MATRLRFLQHQQQDEPRIVCLLLNFSKQDSVLQYSDVHVFLHDSFQLGIKTEKSGWHSFV
jgi:hypothetical protein